MPLVLVYPDQIIPRFFAQSPLTQEECNEKILEIFVEDLRSTFGAAGSAAELKSTITLDHVGGTFQGGGSYTVIIRSCGHMPMVGQYRKPDGRTDPVVLKDAVASYKNWVPESKVYELEEGQITLSPYLGTSFALQCLEYSLEQKLNSIGDFARFIASGLINSRESSQLALKEIHDSLSTWRSWNLSQSISAVIDKICASLGRLFFVSLIPLRRLIPVAASLYSRGLQWVARPNRCRWAYHWCDRLGMFALEAVRFPIIWSGNVCREHGF